MKQADHGKELEFITKTVLMVLTKLDNVSDKIDSIHSNHVCNRKDIESINARCETRTRVLKWTVALLISASGAILTILGIR